MPGRSGLPDQPDDRSGLEYGKHHSTQIPEVGHAVRVRNRLATVRAVEPYDSRTAQGRLHIVEVEYLDDCRYPEAEQLLWEVEATAKVLGTTSLPGVDANRPDSPDGAQAFVNAHRWTRLNRLRESEGIEDEPLLGVWNSAIQVHPYQLEPVLRALAMPRVSLLLADGVGLGKTIQSGLVLEELLLRRRIRRILVVCPAMLQRQWKYELRRKFNLDFEVIDSDSTFQLRRRLGIDTNPWKAFPRIITSMDYLRMPDVLQQFLQASGAGPDAEIERRSHVAARSLGFADRGRVPSLRPAERQPGQPADPDAAGDPLSLRASHLRLGHAAQRQDRLLHRPAGTARPDPLPDDRRDGRQGQGTSGRGPHSPPQGRHQQAVAPASVCRAAWTPVELADPACRRRKSALYAALREYRKKGHAALGQRLGRRALAGPVHLLAADEAAAVLPVGLRPDVVAAPGGRRHRTTRPVSSTWPVFRRNGPRSRPGATTRNRCWKKTPPATAGPGSAARASRR